MEPSFIVAVTLPHFAHNEHEAIVALLEKGLMYVHLRKPDASEAQMRRFVERFPLEWRTHFSIHGFQQLAADYGLGGMHTREPLEIDPSGKRISKSCHSLKEVAECRQRFDYVFLSPLFDSISKQGYVSQLDHDEVSRFLRHPASTPCEVVALGGINEQNADKARQMGFSGIALLGALWAEQNGSVVLETTLANYIKIAEKWNDQ